MVGGREIDTSTGRWLNIFSSCSASLPSDLLRFSLWLFTFSSPQVTLIKPALERFDACLLKTNIAWWQMASGPRHRSLCRFKRHLLDFDEQCGRNFDMRLKANGLYKTHVWKAFGP